MLKLDPDKRRQYERYVHSLRSEKSMIESARYEGIEQGIAEGRKEGIAEGRKEGIAEGEIKAKSQIAKQLKEQGMSAMQIAQITGLTLSIVEGHALV